MASVGTASLHAEPDGRCVLVLEDDYLIAEMLQQAFLDAGASEVLLAASTEAALRMIKNMPIAFASLDYEVHGENSMRVADTLETNRIPYLFFSGNPQALEKGHPRSRFMIAKPKINQLIATAIELWECALDA